MESYFLCLCALPVISRRIHLLWENIRQHHTIVGDSYCCFFVGNPKRHHDGFLLGANGIPTVFLYIAWCEKQKRRLLVVLAYPEAKARVRKTILKQKQDLLGVMSSKSFKTEPIGSIGACWFQRFVMKKIFTQQKNFEKNIWFTHFLTTEFWR